MLAGWPFGLLYWPLGALFGPVVAWNLLLLGTIVAAGLLTYLWLRALDLGPWAAAIGGMAFALAPYRLDQNASGHLLGWAALRRRARSFNQWMLRAGLEPHHKRYQETRRLLEDSLAGDRAGFSARPQGEDIEIVHNEGMFLLARRSEQGEK